ncbi:hypothetical protein KSC_079760 [Ktedonobacter sp. SOSP1-52]|nr:hypothetical protein KSC_079760 [Ktedonobacter sp. SOSP1-52]
MVELIFVKLLNAFRLERERPHALTSSQARLAAKISLQFWQKLSSISRLLKFFHGYLGSNPHIMPLFAIFQFGFGYDILMKIKRLWPTLGDKLFDMPLEVRSLSTKYNIAERS